VEKGRRLDLDRVLGLLGWDLRLLHSSSYKSVRGLNGATICCESPWTSKRTRKLVYIRVFLRSSVFFATVGATAGGVATGCFFVVTEFHVERAVNTAIGTK
jgi:hypothetical protein